MPTSFPSSLIPTSLPASSLFRSGPGEWRFDSGTSFSSRLSGTFLRDSLEGDGRYVHSDGSSTVGTYRRGVLHGEVCEYSATGALTFRGQYRDNTRNGQGTLYHTDGGVYSGDWKSGQFHGPSNVYTYPAASSNSFSLRGRWEDGRLISARLFVDDQPVVDGAEYSHDESEVGGPIALHPLLPDPYEQHCCIVQPSSLGPQAGEGLFARTDLAAGTVVSFYNGVKQWERQTERRHWDLNGNAIALDEAAGVDIDVPPPYSSLACYSATLGHKANHAFDEARQNAEYGHFLHPRFGHIKCVRVRDGRGGVKAGEELLVDYGFDKRGGPRWWREGRKRIQHGSTVAHQPVVGHAERRERGRRSRSSR